MGICRFDRLQRTRQRRTGKDDKLRWVRDRFPLRFGKHGHQPRKPKLLLWKFARLGKMEGKLAALTPNQVASVAAY